MQRHQKEEDDIPKDAFDPKKYDDSQSQMFRIDQFQQTNVDRLHLFDNQTKIIEKGQKRNVLYGSLQEQKKTLYQTLNPYFKMAVSTTGSLAYTAGQNAFYAIKGGLQWAYEKMVNTISYTLQQLPKIIFVVNKSKQNKQFKSSDSFILLQVENDDYESIKKQKEGKVKVVIPLGQDDPQFTQFLKKNNFVQNYSFPIDIDQQSQKSKTSFMIPSESFQVLYQQCIQNAQINQKKQPSLKTQQKVIYRLKDCCVFELEGKNSIQYDLLDRIEIHDKTQQGYIAYPEKILVKNVSNDSQQPSEGNCPLQKILQAKKIEQVIEVTQMKEEKKKIVDETRNVRLQIPQQKKYYNENNKKEKLQFA